MGSEMCIRDRNLLPTYDDLLPPAEAFTDSGDDDDGGWQNDGDPTNDQGNAGWGFTSISDMFDGGGPGQSGDSYSGGIHGDNTVGDTSEGFTSVVSDWFGGGSDDNDSGGGGSEFSPVIAPPMVPRRELLMIVSANPPGSA